MISLGVFFVAMFLGILSHLMSVCGVFDKRSVQWDWLLVMSAVNAFRLAVLFSTPQLQICVCSITAMFKRFFIQ